MTKEYQEYKKTLKVDTLEEILEAFNHCGNVEDFEDLELYISDHAPKILGDFYVEDYDTDPDGEFTLTREFHNPETGDFEKETYNYVYMKTPFYEYYVDITGTFRKTVKVYAKSWREAEDKVEHAFLSREIGFDGSESYQDANFEDVTRDYTNKPDTEMDPPRDVIPL